MTHIGIIIGHLNYNEEAFKKEEGEEGSGKEERSEGRKEEEGGKEGRKKGKKGRKE